MNPTPRPVQGKNEGKQLRIAHLVNCFKPQPDSEFEYVQPITLASMRRAKAACPPNIQVTLLSAQDEAGRAVVPDDFQCTPDLQRDVRTICQDQSLPPFPLIADLLQRLYDNSDAEYLIYTNLDIGVQPHFYQAVADKIAKGHDAFIINRRRISGHYRNVEELPEMYAAQGKPHPGFDCFVFKRELFPHLRLGKVCIGIPYIEILMGQNLFCHAKNFRLFDAEHLTFHIGEDIFKPRNPTLLAHNKAEFWKTILQLWPKLDSRKFPYADRWLPFRLIKWGMHPCIPIRLCLKLEWQQLLGRKNASS